jgi:hypothetical protein
VVMYMQQYNCMIVIWKVRGRYAEVSQGIVGVPRIFTVTADPKACQFYQEMSCGPGSTAEHAECMHST